jgi:hypothetical protein
MAEAEHVTQLQRPLPKTVPIPDTAEGLTPNEMRKLKEASGRRLDELFGEEADLDDKTQALVWIQLHRAGYEASWDDAGDVMPVGREEETDPTSGGRPTASPPSSDTGDSAPAKSTS